MYSEKEENNSILNDIKPLEKVYSKCYKNLDKFFYKTKQFFDKNLFNNKIKNKRNYSHIHSFSSEFKKHLKNNKLNKSINIDNITLDQFIKRIKTIIEKEKNKTIKKNNDFEHINESFYIENTKNNNFLDNFLIVKKEKENMKKIEEKKKRELHLFFKEKIEFEKNKQKKIKKLINERHCPGQYYPNYSSIYKKVPFVIFSKFSYRNNNSINKTNNKSSLNLKSEIKINNNNNQNDNSSIKNNIKLKKILITSKLKNRNNFIKNKINKSFFKNNNKLETEDSFIEKINKNYLKIFKNLSKNETTPTSSESKKIKTRNYEKTNSLINKSSILNYSNKIYNKNKSMENYNNNNNNFNKIKIKKKYKNYNNNKNIIHSFCFNKMSGRENNNIKNDSPFNLYSPNYNTIQPNIKSVYFGNKNDENIFNIKKKIVDEKIHYYNQNLDYFILNFKKYEQNENQFSK